MNQVVFRKIALSIASISFGGVMSVVLLFSICVRSPIYCRADNLEKQSVLVPGEGIPISCTPLVVEVLASYDGAFYEDGSGEEVMGVAALELYNSSDVTVPYAWVIVYTDNCRYEFEATMLPPNSSVLIPESHKTLLTEREIVSCFGWMTVSNSRMPKGVAVTVCDEICITNNSSRAVYQLSVYHRTYLEDDKVYVGGQAFKTEIPYIAPGDSITFLPPNFAPGYSRVVWYAL